METTCGMDQRSWNFLRSLHHLWGGARRLAWRSPWIPGKGLLRFPALSRGSAPRKVLLGCTPRAHGGHGRLCPLGARLRPEPAEPAHHASSLPESPDRRAGQRPPGTGARE